MADFATFNGMIKLPKTQDYLVGVLGERKSDFVTNITSLVANDKNLQACEPVTIMYAGITATSLGLSLNKNLGQAYVIHYKNKNGVSEAQFQIGYKGIIQLAIRSGQFQTMNVTDVREGEIKGYDLLTGEIVIEAKPRRETLPIIGYASFFRLTNGFTKILYMTKDEMEQHGIRYSQSYGSNKDFIKSSSKWTTDFDAMAKKTVLKLLLSRYAPLSVDMVKAITRDQAVMRTEEMIPEYVDNQPQDIQADDVTNEATVVAKILKAGTREELDTVIMGMPEELAHNERVRDAVEKKQATL